MTEQEIHEVSERLYLWFVILHAHGFTEDQALRLVIGMMTDGI